MTAIVVRAQAAIAEWHTNPAAAAALLQAMLREFEGEPAKRFEALSHLLMYQEFYHRMRRGLSPDHGSHVADLGYTFARKQFMDYYELATELNGFQGARIAAHFCRGEFDKAQAALDAINSAGSIWDNATFDPAFYAALDLETFEGLPEVKTALVAGVSEKPVYLLACDGKYLEKFGLPMLRSIAEADPKAVVHVHIMDPLPDQSVPLDTNLTIGATVERPAADPGYYHAMRFVRLHQLLDTYRGTVWLLDVDGLVNRPLEALAPIWDAGFRVRPGRLEPWNQFNASVVAATQTQASRDYFRRVAAYIVHFWRKGQLRWGIDQLAMWGVWQSMAKDVKVRALGPDVVDYRYCDDGAVWCNSGSGKHGTEIPEPRQRYYEKFKRMAALDG